MGGFALLGPEILTNGDFETGSYNPWSVEDTNVTTAYVTDDGPYTGTEHAWFECSSSGVKAWFQQKNITIPQSGATYLLTAAIAASNGSYHAVQINNVWSSVNTFVPTTTDGNTWAFYDWEFDSILAGAAADGLRFTMPAVDPLVMLFDDISLRQKIDFYPGQAYRKARQLDRSNMRTADGTLHTFTGSINSTRINIPLTWISSKDAADLSSWWETGANLRFYENDSSPASYYSVRMVGKENPFQQFQRPYPAQYLQGKIELVTL